MNTSSSPDISPEMKVDEVVNAVGAMSAKDRGFDSHKEHSAQANKQKSSKKQEGSIGKSEVRKRLHEPEQGESEPKQGKRELRIAVREQTKKAEFGWAAVAIKKGLEGNVKLLRDKGEQLVQGFTTSLMADVNEGHSVMLQVSGHWLLIAKIQDEITCFDPRKTDSVCSLAHCSCGRGK